MDNALEGRWKQLAATENGAVIDHEDEIVLDISGSGFAVKRNGALEIEGVFEVDCFRNPTSIDWRDSTGADSGKLFRSFCVVEQDCFEFCAADEGLPRPENLEAAQGHTVRRFKRLR